MEEYHQITIQEYLDWKEDLRRRLAEAANNFVGIGYRLKQIRDSEAYRQDGYTSIFDFASKEYGISSSQASRFMAINDKFSKNGNSLEMPEEFSKLGSSKLSEMLTLPESDYQYIDENTTRDQIRELKAFNKQDMNEPEAPESVQDTPKNVPEFEKTDENLQKTEETGEEPHKPEKEDPLTAVMWEDFRDKERIFDKCQKAAGLDAVIFAKAMNPTGSALAKKGKFMLFLKKPGETNLMKILGFDAVKFSWEDIKAAFTDEFRGKGEWKDIFAPAQMEEEKPEKPDKQIEREAVTPKENEENTDVKEGGDAGNADKNSETTETAKEETQENTEPVEVVTPEDAEKHIDGEAITVSKSVDFAMSETKENAKELKNRLEDIALFDESTSVERLEDIIKNYQELTVAFLCSLQDWKKAKEREDKK